MKLPITLCFAISSLGLASAQTDPAKTIARIVNIPKAVIKTGTVQANFDWMAVQNFDWHYQAPDWVYDKSTRTYGDNYVNPKGYRIVLDARSSTLPRSPGPRYPRYHWKIEKVTKAPFKIGSLYIIREKLTQIYETTKIGLPILSLTNEVGGDIIFRTRTNGSNPDSEVEPKDIDHISLVAHGPMLPSEGNYKITLEIIDDYIDGESNKAIAKVSKYVLIKDFVIVIFGDSNASGEGNPQVNGSYGGTGFLDFNDECNGGKFSEMLPDIVGDSVDYASLGLLDTTIHMNSPVEWLEPTGHRSANSGHFLAARRLMTNPKIFATILSFANSGASHAKGMNGPQKSFHDVGQIEEAKRTLGNRQVDFALMSMGINELDFEDFITDLMTGGELIYFFTGEGHQIPRDMYDKLESIYGKVGGLCESIKITFPNPKLKVYVTEYPEGVFQNESKELDVSCGMFGGFFLGISDIEGLIIEGVNKELNAKVRRGASFRSRVKFIDGIAKKFHGHGYCSTLPYFIQHDESCHIQGDFRGVLHPNALGHHETATLIYEQLEKDVSELKFKNAHLEF